MKKLLIICAILSLSSCDILKESQKVKKDITESETIKTQIKRAGDTLRIEVPKITYKDTTIVKTNYVNRTEARITYDKNGNTSVECISSEINELREEIRTFQDNSKEKESKKEESFQSEIVIYVMLGLALIVLIFMWKMKSQTNAITDILRNITKN